MGRGSIRIHLLFILPGSPALLSSLPSSSSRDAALPSCFGLAGPSLKCPLNLQPFLALWGTKDEASATVAAPNCGRLEVSVLYS